MDRERWDRFERKMDRYSRRMSRFGDRFEDAAERRRWRSYSTNPGRHLLAGIVFVAIGLVFLLGNMGVLDADRIARDVVPPGSPALARIARTFGREMLRPDGTLDRAALGS